MGLGICQVNSVYDFSWDRAAGASPCGAVVHPGEEAELSKHDALRRSGDTWDDSARTTPRRCLLTGRCRLTRSLHPAVRSERSGERAKQRRGLHIADDVQALRQRRTRRTVGPGGSRQHEGLLVQRRPAPQIPVTRTSASPCRWTAAPVMTSGCPPQKSASGTPSPTPGKSASVTVSVSARGVRAASSAAISMNAPPTTIEPLALGQPPVPPTASLSGALFLICGASN